MAEKDKSVEQEFQETTRNADSGKSLEKGLHTLSDVSLYSLTGLCAISLMNLFDDDWHRDFKKETLQKVLGHLKQPKQTWESMFALMGGDLMDDCQPFSDQLLQEPALKESRVPVILDLVTLAIGKGCYDARMRVLIKHVAWHVRVSWDDLEDVEMTLAETLEENSYEMSEEEKAEKEKKLKKRKVKRYALIGLATVGGGALIGLTGGLAAPLVAAGAGAIIGGAGAAALGSTAGVAIIGSLFGVAGAGLTGYKMKRRVGAIEEFAFEPLTVIGSRRHEGSIKQLHITIAVTGWLSDSMLDCRRPWSCLGESKEQYCLRWESKYLLQLGNAFDYILQAGVTVATNEALKYTILSGIMTAIAWPAALISAAGVIDNPWHVCTQRATAVGKQLAEVLLGRDQGNRPVTLVGFSLGARVIFSCLEELSKRKGSEGLVEDVILLGTPVSGDPKHWRPLARVVAGKIVNGYSRGDWFLKFLYRTASIQFSIAGLAPVKWDNRRMHNIDLSNVIDGHKDYMKQLETILKVVGVRTKDEVRPLEPKASKSTKTSDEVSLEPGCRSEGPGGNLKRESGGSENFVVVEDDNSSISYTDSWVSGDNELSEVENVDYEDPVGTDSKINENGVPVGEVKIQGTEEKEPNQGCSVISEQSIVTESEVNNVTAEKEIPANEATRKEVENKDLAVRVSESPLDQENLKIQNTRTDAEVTIGVSSLEPEGSQEDIEINKSISPSKIEMPTVGDEQSEDSEIEILEECFENGASLSKKSDNLTDGPSKINGGSSEKEVACTDSNVCQRDVKDAGEELEGEGTVKS